MIILVKSRNITDGECNNLQSDLQAYYSESKRPIATLFERT